MQRYQLRIESQRFLPYRTKMCEQQYLLIIGYGFWGTLKDMYQGWVYDCYFEKVNIRPLFFVLLYFILILEISFYLYGGTRKKVEQGVYYWEYDKIFSNKKFEDEFNKKFKKDLKNGYLIKVVLFEAEK